MAKNNNKDIKYVGDSRVPAKRVPNISPSYAEFPGNNEPFWPNFLLKEWMVAAVILVAFLILTVSHPSPLEPKANPNDSSYTPLPDWYFLFLYQLLKYPFAAGKFKVVGTVIIPGIAFGALFLAPWLDRGPERRPSKRPIATGLMLLSLVAIFYLTWAAMAEHNAHSPSASGGKGDASFTLPEGPGKAIWQAQQGCISCHGTNMEGAAGPSLQKVGSKLSADEIKQVIKDGRGAMPPGMFKGTDEELDTLAQYLAGLK